MKKQIKLKLNVTKLKVLNADQTKVAVGGYDTGECKVTMGQ